MSRMWLHVAVKIANPTLGPISTSPQTDKGKYRVDITKSVFWAATDELASSWSDVRPDESLITRPSRRMAVDVPLWSHKRAFGDDRPPPPSANRRRIRAYSQGCPR